MICKNCENDFEGSFCNNCGQKKNVQKVNLNYLIDEISNSFFQVNSGIFFTLKELSIRPGKSINDFLNGKRKQHYKPLAFVLLTSAIYILVTYFFKQKTYSEVAIISAISGLETSSDEKGLLGFENLLNWFLNNFTYLTLLFVPTFSLASYLLFIKEKYNYFEHLILNLYITGLQTIISIILYSLFIVFKIELETSYIGLLALLLPFSYTFWTFIQFFKNKKMFSTIILTILTHILFVILMLIISILVMLIIKTIIK